jgi:hypothetical protein
MGKPKTMNAQAREHREGPASPADALREAAGALVAALDRSEGLAKAAGARVRAACEEAHKRLGEARVTVALVGDAGVGRRTLVNALLGARVLTTGTPRRGSTFTFVRRGRSVGFSARSVEGRWVARLADKLPDRDAAFDAAMAGVARESAARELIALRLQRAREQAGGPPGMRDDPGAARGPQLVHVATHTSPRRARPQAERLWRAIWSWIVQLVRWLSARARLPAARPAPGERVPHAAAPADGPDQDAKGSIEKTRDTISAVERELGSMRSAEQISAEADGLRLEREKYEQERRAMFLSQVRAFDGTDVAERIVEYPTERLPEGMTIMDLPCGAPGEPTLGPLRNRVEREVDGLMFVTEADMAPTVAMASLLRELTDVVPLVLVVVTKADRWGEGTPERVGASSRIEEAPRQALRQVQSILGLAAAGARCMAVSAERALASPGSAEPFRAGIEPLSNHLAHDRRNIVARREAMRLRRGVAELTRERAREEDSCRTRLSRLESHRIADPTAFRAKLMHRLDGAIEESADHVLAGGLQGLDAALGGVRAEWKGWLAECSSRSEIDACIAAIDQQAASRIAKALEQTAELVAGELHEATAALASGAHEEIYGEYRLVRRLGTEAFEPVASELTREDLERELLAQPLEGAMNAFEKQRVGYGLGGVTAGALVGTLIAPGIGTAVGAVVGVLAGLLKGTDSLKQECLSKIDACLDGVRDHARAQLQERRPDFSRVIRVTLEERLEEALGRLGGAIARLMVVERHSIDAERSKLERLAALRRDLEASEGRLEALLNQASRPEDQPKPMGGGP